MLFNNICIDEAIKKTEFLELNEKACQNLINTAKETQRKIESKGRNTESK